MRESKFEAQLIEKLVALFPGCTIIKNDASKQQGIPDLTIFWRNHWAMLEVKGSRSASVQPNQEYYVEHMNDMSFAAFIYPENEEEVLYELQRSFGFVRKACVS